jgi:hypothetical protein
LDIAAQRTRSEEAAEDELTRFIEKRHDQRVKTEGERREEELWMESARRYHERQREPSEARRDANVNMDNRLRRLEERAGDNCPECAGGAGIVVTYPSETEAEALEGEPRCPRCGRALTIIRVVYEDEAKPGGGVIPIG